MNCVSCGAGLAPKSAVCRHCGTLNDIDLRGLFEVAARRPDHSRVCPRCECTLESLDLGLEQPFFIERCERCLGLFFDPGELDAVVKSRVGRAERIDRERLGKLLEEETTDAPGERRYLKCPTCRTLMHRRSGGTLAGVVIDECSQHGVWLDGGELRRVMVWTKAGGPRLAAQRRRQQERHEEQMRRLDEPTRPATNSSSVPDSSGGVDGAGELITFIATLMFDS